MTAKKNAPRLLTYADLADRYGVPVGTIRQWVSRGKLPEPDYRVGQSPAWLPATIDGVVVSDLRSSE